MQDRSAVLQGKIVAVTAERRADHQMRFLRTRGATVIHAPVLRTLDVRDQESLQAATAALVANPADVVVVQTGQGLRWWLDGAETTGRLEGLRDSLGQTQFVTRGAKASSAVRQLGFDVSWQSERETIVDVAAYLRTLDLAGKRVAIQHDGSVTATQALCSAAVDASGGEVIDLDVYRYALPEDPGPVSELIASIIAGTVDAVTFTASPAIRNLRQIADDLGQRGDLDRAFGAGSAAPICTAVVVGPVCTKTTIEAGWTGVVEPATARLMPMLEALVVDLVG